MWRRSDVGQHRGKLRRVPPILAVEIQGQFEDEVELRQKAAWYLDHGVEVVWLLFPSEPRMVVLTATNEQQLGVDGSVPAHPSLPGLEPEVAELFHQIRSRG